MSLNRDRFLKTAAAAAAGAAAGVTRPHIAFGADYAPIGTFPDGTKGDSVFVGIITPLTGSYSADGVDMQKGYELAFEDLNAGTGVMGKIPSLGGKKGVLGKKVNYRIADSETKPDVAVQHATEFITHDKAIMLSGGVSSAEVIATEKVAQQQKVIYMTGASGSNDTTGKDCQRYAFRSQCDAYMVAKAMAPVLGKNLGHKRKAIYLVPDYSYGHSLADSMAQFCEQQGWSTVNKVIVPFPSTDYSSYLTNIANTDADTLVNIEFGNDGVASIKQAQQFGLLKRMTLVVPNISTYLPDGVGAETMQGVYGTVEWYPSLESRYPLSKVFISSFVKKHGIRPRWTAHVAYAQVAIWADAVTRVKTFYPPEIIKTIEAGHPVELMLGKVFYRAGDHQQVRPVPVVIGKKPSEMTAKDDFFKIVDLVPGDKVLEPLADTMCKLPAYT
ncbi:MAG: ABC transporter substrate-binding protein [Vulcanimicrobiaceae bacterium]